MSKPFTPRPYQQQIIRHILSHPRCMVWAGMGTGKTVSTLTAVRMIQGIFLDTRALVIAPLRVAQSTWPEECAKWDHLADAKVSVITGTPKQRFAALQANADIYCINYENIPWLVEQIGVNDWPFGIIVADESTRLKNYRRGSGKTSRAKWLAAVAHRAKHFIELTGTPTANGLIDLWGQAWFIDKGAMLGRTFGAYQQAYFRAVRTGGEAYMVRYEPNFGSDEKIKTALKPYTITINAEDWFDIKEPIVNDVFVTMPKKAQTIYEDMESTFYAVLDEDEEVAAEAVNAQGKLVKCLQIASGAVYDSEGLATSVHDAKMDAFRSIVEEAAGAPILVAYQFKHEEKRILEAFPQARKLDRNPQTIRDWNEGKIPILIAHPASCGHGLNLQDGGNILVFFSCGFNYEQYAQMCERIGPTRQVQAGHPRPVFIHRIIANKTLDKAVIGALQRKQNVLDFVIGRRKP